MLKQKKFICLLLLLVNLMIFQNSNANSIKILHENLNKLAISLKDLQSKLKNLSKQLQILHSSLLTFKTKLRFRVENVDFLSTIFKLHSEKNPQEVIEQINDEKLNEVLPHLSQHYNVKELIKIFLEEEKKHDLQYCGCENAPFGKRIVYALKLLNAIVEQYPNKDNLLVHTEFAGEAGFQDFIHALGLLLLGYKKIIFNIININLFNTAKMKEKIT